MHVKYLLFLIFPLTCYLTSCQTKKKIKKEDLAINVLDTSRISILPMDTSKYKTQWSKLVLREFVWENGKEVELLKADIPLLDSLLLKAVESYNEGEESKKTKREL